MKLRMTCMLIERGSAFAPLAGRGLKLVFRHRYQNEWPLSPRSRGAD